MITKTGTALLGTGLAAAAISNELYVVNEETILLIGSIIVFTYIGKVRVFFQPIKWINFGEIYLLVFRSRVSHTANGQRVTFNASRKSLTVPVLSIHMPYRSALIPSVK